MTLSQIGVDSIPTESSPNPKLLNYGTTWSNWTTPRDRWYKLHPKNDQPLISRTNYTLIHLLSYKLHQYWKINILERIIKGVKRNLISLPLIVELIKSNTWLSKEQISYLSCVLHLVGPLASSYSLSSTFAVLWSIKLLFAADFLLIL